MKKIVLVLLLSLFLANCAKNNESSLTLPPGAEPSAKIHNDRGIAHSAKGKYFDALLAFIQASVADDTTGEIHFNIALMLHRRGKEERAAKHFQLARKFANGNQAILESGLLKKYMDPE